MNKKENPLDAAMKRIKQEKIQQKSKMQVLLEHSALWIPGLVSVIIGAFAVAAIIFAFRNAGWEYRYLTHATQFGFIIDILPSLWILLLAIFAFVAMKALRKTRKGYRYGILSILGLSIVLSVGLGSGMYAFGLGEMVDRKLSEVVPGRLSAEKKQQKIWNTPDKGRLAGVAQTKVVGDRFSLEDFNNRQWVVNTSQARGPIERLVQSGEQVRIIGYNDDIMFHACAVIPWELRGLPQGGRNISSDKERTVSGRGERISRESRVGKQVAQRGEEQQELRDRVRKDFRRNVEPETMRRIHQHMIQIVGQGVESCEDLFGEIKEVREG